MSKIIISTTQAPGAIGPYSQAINAGGLVFVSGQLPVDPASGEIHGDIRIQTEQALRNVTAVLEAAGAALEDVVKTTVFLKDLGDFAVMNEVYSRFFKQDPPARSCVQVAAIPKGALIEIESIAVKVV